MPTDKENNRVYRARDEKRVTPGPKYVFVGEKRSHRAIAMNVTWADGRLSAKTLQDALRQMDVDPDMQVYVNLFLDGEGWRVDITALSRARSLHESGTQVVALGRRVQRLLAREGVRHLGLVHPAARGTIRTRDRYRAHVASVLCGTAREVDR
jgi:hypothetical protein